MTNDEAKFILSAYRPNGGDAEGAAFGEALAQARRDPALASWFSREQAQDALVASKLRQISPPAGLRESILAGARAEGAQARRRAPRWLALAAALALSAGAAALWWSMTPPKESDPLIAFALHDTAHGRHGGHGGPTSALQAILGRPETRLGSALPVDFAALEATGCRTLASGGHPILEICFVRAGAEFHCYIARVADFPHAAPAGVQRDGFGAMSFSDGAHHFVVVSAAGLPAIRQLI